MKLQRRIMAIAALAVLLFAGSGVAFVGMRREFQARLTERAQFETERALERYEGAPLEAPPLEETCSVGELRAGVTEHDDPSSFTALGLGPLDASRVVRTAKRDGVMRFDVGDAHGTKVVIATRSRPDGRLAWAGIRVAAPAVVQFWKVVAGALVLVFALLLVAAVDALRRVRAASTTLTSSARALVSDLRAPIPEPEVHELAGVAGALRSLASGLDSARHSHEELTAALAQERQLAALGRVAAAIAHEVRNPLAAIKLRVDLVCEGTGSAAERQVDLEVLAREVDRLSRLVTNLLAHTRASAAEPTSRDLAALARERAAMLVPLARQRDVAIEVGGSGSAPVDLDAATRALDNLLRNALDAAPTNTRIEIDVRTREGATEIAVSDHGSGIPADRMAELFEPFFTTKPGGTGLGLSLARAIVRAHAGELTHHRSAHRTTFTMSFPHEHD